MLIIWRLLVLHTMYHTCGRIILGQVTGPWCREVLGRWCLNAIHHQVCVETPTLVDKRLLQTVFVTNLKFGNI